MKSCGLEPTKTSHNKYWNRDLLINSIKELSRSGHPLTVKSIWKDRSGTTTKTIYRAIGRKTTGSGLHDAARRYFGSWDQALKACDIDSELIKEKPFWTKKKIVWAIKAVQENNIALNTDKIGRDCSRQTSKIIKQAVGKERFGRSLYGGAYRKFGSWDRALHEANVNPIQVRKTKFYWNNRSLRRLLNLLYENEVPINISSLSKDRSDQTNALLFNYTGQKIKAPALVKLGKQKFGSWDETLKSAGFRLCEIRRSGKPCFKDIDKIIEAIRTLYRHEYPLNRSAIGERSHLIKEFMEDHFDSPISGMSVFHCALLFFENWDDVLWEAGLDPSNIRLRSRPNTSNFPILLTQKETVKTNALFSQSNFLGAPPETPYELLDNKDKSKNFWSAFEKVTDDDRGILEEIFDKILNLHHYKDQKQMIKFISQDLNEEVSEERISALLNSFKRHLIPN
jgi:hypothetical protein